VSQLTSIFQFNDISSLKQILDAEGSEYAAIIMEPMNLVYPEPGFLEEVKSLCHKNGSLLIFDETVTGFRLNIGGAQALFGVTPDLACFGKGMANGFPISAVVGRTDIMSMFDEVFFSFTFGGELLSIAAAIKTMDILEADQVLNTIENRGKRLIKALSDIFKKYELADDFSVSGHPSWSFINFKIKDEAKLYKIKTLFMQECISRGLLTLGSNNLSYAIDDLILEKVIRIYDEVFELISNVINSGASIDLRCETLKPLFKVRNK
jgi:glutamate-1-semialdehyde aminotransferase